MIEVVPTNPSSDPRPTPPRREHDPEFDAAPRRVARQEPRGLPQDYQRLVANPFLALLGLVGWFVWLRHGLVTRNLSVSLLSFSSLIAVVFLLQYHCLDCGATGWLFRWRRHACERVKERRLAGTPRRYRGPTPVLQAVLWTYTVAILGIVAAIALAGRL